jgi:hypothetical protein
MLSRYVSYVITVRISDLAQLDQLFKGLGYIDCVQFASPSSLSSRRLKSGSADINTKDIAELTFHQRHQKTILKRPG